MPLYCSTFELDFADKTSAGDEKCFIVSQRPDRKMFEPECQNIDCPQCILGEIYFDREMGYYCMLCGHEFSVVDMEVLIEKTALTSLPLQKSERSRKKPIVEIMELPAHKPKAKHIRRDVIERKTPEQ